MAQATDLFRRKAVRDKVKACRACDLRERCDLPVPFSGVAQPKLVVIGEAPGAIENEMGEPFVGPSGQLVRSWLKDCGWNVGHDIAFVNSVCCFPNRTPTKDEVNACQTNLYEQLAYIDCGRALVLGGIAIQALLNPQVRVGEVRGLWWRVDRLANLRPIWCLATWHPAAVLRNKNLSFEAFDDVSYMSLIVQRELEPSRGQFCVKCGSPEVDFVSDIPYCGRHRPK